jgi:glycine dehydrogenase
MSVIPAADSFLHRHLGPRASDVTAMLATIGAASLDDLVAQTIPAAIRTGGPDGFPGLPTPATEAQVLRELGDRAGRKCCAATSAWATTARSRRR